MATIESSDAFQFTSLPIKIKKICRAKCTYDPSKLEASRRASRRHFIGEEGSIEQESTVAHRLLQEKAAAPVQ